MADDEYSNKFELNIDEIAGFSQACEVMDVALKNFGVDLPTPARIEILAAALVAFVSYGGLDGPTRRYLKNKLKPELVDQTASRSITYKTSRPEHS